jgi:hypothetical protein
MSVVDIVLNIIDIVEVVDQCKKMCEKLNGPIKGSYKSSEIIHQKVKKEEEPSRNALRL